MGQKSQIEWTDSTWNPVTGCTKVSPGCKHCYAERLAGRLKAMGVERYRNGFEVRLQPDALEDPLHWRKPRMVFVNSMSDLFHELVPLDYLQRVFNVMHRAPQHTYQILTKRAARLAELGPQLPWTPNIWIGVSVETEEYVSRVALLRTVPAHVRFLSIEPLLGAISKIDLSGISWVIVGGESGPDARPMDAAWVRSIRDMCLQARVPFFFKQWGGVQKSRTGRSLDGRTWDELPVARQVSLFAQ